MDAVVLYCDPNEKASVIVFQTEIETKPNQTKRNYRSKKKTKQNKTIISETKQNNEKKPSTKAK